MRTVLKVQTPDRKLNQVQDNIMAALDPLLRSPLASSALLEGIVIATGTNRISHGLGRALRGWIVTRKSAAVSLYDSQGSNALPDRLLLLVSDGAATVDLLVF